MKTCLMITPLSFYGWHNVISKELVARGYQVTVSTDEYPMGLFGLIVGNFVNPLSRLLTYLYYKRKLKNLDYDLIVIFKGRGLSSKLIHFLKSRSKKVIGYNFDSFSYFSNSLRWYQEVDEYATFDVQDAEEKNIRRVDLYSDFPFDQPVKKHHISCVMKNHSDRLEYLDRLYSALRNEYTFYVYIYEKNYLTLIKSVLKNPILVWRWRRDIHLTSLNAKEYMTAISSSYCTLDYAHPKQTGLTMRCFQSASYGTKIVTNNHYVRSIGYLPRDLFFVYRIGDEVQAMREFVSGATLKPVRGYSRTVGDFVDDLLGEVPPSVGVK